MESIILLPPDWEARTESIFNRVLDRLAVMQTERLLNAKEVQAILSVSNVTLWQYCKKGLLKSEPRENTKAKLFFKLSDIKTFAIARSRKDQGHE